MSAEKKFKTALDETRLLIRGPGISLGFPFNGTADNDAKGIADRTLVKPGKRLSAIYQIPEGFNPALGHDVLEVAVTR